MVRPVTAAGGVRELVVAAPAVAALTVPDCRTIPAVRTEMAAIERIIRRIADLLDHEMVVITV
jgi:hypothetical protein